MGYFHEYNIVTKKKEKKTYHNYKYITFLA